jgi:hypothetical protein
MTNHGCCPYSDGIATAFEKIGRSPLPKLDKAAQAELIRKARALAHHSQPDSGTGEAAARRAPSYLERGSTD